MQGLLILEPLNKKNANERNTTKYYIVLLSSAGEASKEIWSPQLPQVPCDVTSRKRQGVIKNK